MEPEVKEIEAPVVEPQTNITIDEAGTLAPVSSQSTEQWREIADKTYTVLASLPEILGRFFTEYRKPLVTVGLIFGSIVSVKLTLALLGAINDIPLLEPTFELIGLAYSAWFVYRYLLKAETRQEFGQQFNKLKQQVIGQVTQ